MELYKHPLGKPEASIPRPAFDCGLPCIGTVNSKSTDETSSSNWYLGCETLDRDYTDYDQYKDYLKPLGIHTARLQGQNGKR